MALPTSASMPASAPVGSEPLSTVNGAPLWKVKKDASCQPPRIFLTHTLLVAHPRQLPDEVAGQPVRPVVR